MDIFVEQIVKKEVSKKDWTIRVLTGIGMGVLSAISVFVFLFILPIPGLALLLVCGIIYGGYRIITNSDCEYEYIVTNGEIDIDKIIAKRNRIRLITAKASTFEAFGLYKDAPKAESSVTVVSAVGECSGSSEDTAYYADFKHASAGNVRLVFTPEERVIDAIVPFLPRQLKVNFRK